MGSYLANKARTGNKISLITVCKGWVHYTINCFSRISIEQRASCYSETRCGSNVSGAYTCWKPLIKLTFFSFIANGFIHLCWGGGGRRGGLRKDCTSCLRVGTGTFLCCWYCILLVSTLLLVTVLTLSQLWVKCISMVAEIPEGHSQSLWIPVQHKRIAAISITSCTRDWVAYVHVHTHTHTPSTVFWHLPPNSARFGYATEGAHFIKAQLSTNVVSAIRKVWVLSY